MKESNQRFSFYDEQSKTSNKTTFFKTVKNMQLTLYVHIIFDNLLIKSMTSLSIQFRKSFRINFESLTTKVRKLSANTNQTQILCQQLTDCTQEIELMLPLPQPSPFPRPPPLNPPPPLLLLIPRLTPPPLMCTQLLLILSRATALNRTVLGTTHPLPSSLF